MAGCYAGWRLFWFLTDDAFIAFRFVDQSLRGHGLVWNPPPFHPVEGYTSLLWVLVLREVWQIAGVPPPQSANWLSLGCGLATMGFVAALAWRMQLAPALARWRLAWIALVALGILTNRTFLAWLSSGLETALFNLGVTWWLFAATSRDPRRPMAVLNLSLSAAVLATTRPDGLLFVAATVLIETLDARTWRPQRRTRWALALAPLLVVPAHVIWRRLYYGAWAPNTYYAKVVGSWPEAGWRYLLSFILEYGLVVWLLVAGWWALKATMAWRRGDGSAGGRLTIPVGTVLAHAAYYTLVVGGDHFEYRVFSHLIPLLFLSGFWLLSRLTARPAVVVGVLLVMIGLSWPIPWVHWRATHALVTRNETRGLFRPVAPYFPRLVQPVVGYFDQLQQWLIAHQVGLRHQEHKVFYETMQRDWSTWTAGTRYTADQRLVIPIDTIGVPGWSLPEVAILDLHGLADRVIARTPVADPADRSMAHDRHPPSGYVECFGPNLRETEAGLERVPDAPPVSDETIRTCEDDFWRAVTARSR